MGEKAKRTRKRNIAQKGQKEGEPKRQKGPDGHEGQWVLLHF